MAKSSADMYKKHLERAKTLNDATSATNWTGSSAAEHPKRGCKRLKELLRKKSKNTHRTSTEVGTHELWSNAQCRTCFEDIDTTNFHELTEQIDPVKSLTDLLGDIAKIDVKNEIERNLPQKMCETCFQALRNAYSFIVQAQLVQEYLLSSVYAKDTVEMSEENFYQIPTDISSTSTQIKKEMVEQNDCVLPVDISPNSIQLKIEVNEENMCDYYNVPSTSNEYGFIREFRGSIEEESINTVDTEKSDFGTPVPMVLHEPDWQQEEDKYTSEKSCVSKRYNKCLPATVKEQVASTQAKKKPKLADIGKWTCEKYIRLFEFHEQNPMLWKRSDAQYLNTNTKTRLLEEIGMELGCPGEEAKLRFRSMKQTYQKSCKKLPKSGSGSCTQKEWRFAKNLSFLDSELTKDAQADSLGGDETVTVPGSETLTNTDTHCSSVSTSAASKTNTTLSNKMKRETETHKIQKMNEQIKRDKYDEYGEALAFRLRLIGKQSEAIAEELKLKWHSEAIERLKYLSSRLATQSNISTTPDASNDLEAQQQMSVDTPLEAAPFQESLLVQGLILTEVQSLKKVITHLSEEIVSIRDEARQNGNTRMGILKPSHLPIMPFNEKEPFDNFIKDLIDKETLLNEFKTYLLRLGGPDVPTFLRAAMKALLTDNLAQKFSWKGTKEKPALIANFAVTVIKGICYQKFPNSDDFRVNCILQKHLIYAKDRIEKNRKRHGEENN